MKKKILQKLAKFYSIDELDDYYSIVFQKLVSMRYSVSENFFKYLINFHEKRYRRDYRRLLKVEKREFKARAKMYEADQKAGKITPYLEEKKEDNISASDLKEFMLNFLTEQANVMNKPLIGEVNQSLVKEQGEG